MIPTFHWYSHQTMSEAYDQFIRTYPMGDHELPMDVALQLGPIGGRIRIMRPWARPLIVQSFHVFGRRRARRRFDQTIRLFDPSWPYQS